MAGEAVTVVVTQRERFSTTSESLASIYEHASIPFRCVYVDGGSPPPIRDDLVEQAGRRGFQLLRRDYYLSQNEARNLAIPLVDTPYVCFVDNDMIAFPGWLEHLVRCAEETGAALVGPLYGVHTRAEGHKVHTTVGRYRETERSGRRTFTYKLDHEGETMPDVGSSSRQPCQHVEFHCMLVRVADLAGLGPLDEELPGSFDHVDLCLAVLERGGTIWSEPAAQVSYLQPPPFARFDLPLFELRWSEAWDASSSRHFRAKWGVHRAYRHRVWLRDHRALVYHWIPEMLTRWLGKRPATAVLAVTAFPIETLVNRAVVAVIAADQRKRRRAAVMLRPGP